MELITNRNRMPAPRRDDLPTLYNAPADEPWAVEIRRMTTPAAFVRDYCPANLPRIAEAFPGLFDGEHWPMTIVRAARALGPEPVLTAVRNLITAALMELAESRTTRTEAVEAVATKVLESDKLRRLTMASLMKFFHRLSCGEYKIYGREITARAVLEALHEQYPRLRAEEDAAHQLAAQTRPDDGQPRTTWAQYAPLHGIDLEQYPDMVDYITSLHQGEEPPQKAQKPP